MRVSVGEEFTMWPAEVYNMGMLRSAWGRKEMCDIDMDAYHIKGNYWGRVPIKILLGDPLQMRPVRSISLLDTKEMLLERITSGQEVSSEAQWGIKAFKDFDVAFELTETKRFIPGDPLGPFLRSLREADPDAGKVVDESLWNLFRKQWLKTDQKGSPSKDPRLLEAKFQSGHSLALYWQTVVRFFFARARRESHLLSVPLFWCQAADDIKGLEALSEKDRKDVLKGLLRTWNIHETGHLHTMLPLYPGARVRLTEKLSAYDWVVQDSEGIVLAIAPDPADDQDMTLPSVTLTHCPLGAWVCMDSCRTTPLADNLADKIDHSALEALWRLVCRDPSEQFTAEPNVKPVHERVIFVPAVTRSFNRSIAGKKWSVRRRQLPLTSAQNRTVQPSQGKNLSQRSVWRHGQQDH